MRVGFLAHADLSSPALTDRTLLAAVMADLPSGQDTVVTDLVNGERSVPVIVEIHGDPVRLGADDHPLAGHRHSRRHTLGQVERHFDADASASVPR